MLADRVHAALRSRVQLALLARVDLLSQASAALPEVSEQLASASASLRRLEREINTLSDELRLYGEPFSAPMTVHAAWLRHPGAAAVFARHHLPACDRCAVRFDERLGEAAAAYGLDLEALLAELNALLDGG